MRLCFIVEARYRADGMPLEVARQLSDWGHEIDLLEPERVVTLVSDLFEKGPGYDAWVLKTVSDGPGLCLLEAAAISGITTINDARAIRPTRDKAVAAALARRHGLPFPTTYFAASPEALRQVPADDYPLVIKPTNGSCGRSIYLVEHPAALAGVLPALTTEGFLMAQPYVTNPGVDIKIYNTGNGIYATVQRSPLHPTVDACEELIELDPELGRLAARVGAAFGLDLYGLDVLETPDGWVIVDVNDFPSFHLIPDAVPRVADAILRLARQRSEQLVIDLVAAETVCLEQEATS